MGRRYRAACHSCCNDVARKPLADHSASSLTNTPLTDSFDCRPDVLSEWHTGIVSDACTLHVLWFWSKNTITRLFVKVMLAWSHWLYYTCKSNGTTHVQLQVAWLACCKGSGTTQLQHLQGDQASLTCWLYTGILFDTTHGGLIHNLHSCIFVSQVFNFGQRINGFTWTPLFTVE